MSANNNSANNKSGNQNGGEVEELDDMMFDMTAPNQRQHTSTKTKSGQPTTPNANTQYVTESGQAKDAWFREEEMMRKKLEKGAIN